jgi:uncharacterized protein (DUF342 family)
MEARLFGQAESGVDRKHIQLAITNLVREEGLKHGLSAQQVREAVETLCSGGEVKDLVIAKGTAPHPGLDARIEVLVPMSDMRLKAQVDDGRVDFRDRGSIPTVEKGTPIAVLHPAEPGQPGRNVIGEVIKPQEVRVLRLRKGKGVTLEEDERMVVAAVRGMAIRPEVDKFEVQEILIIKGDVDFKVGHVDFPGVVKVDGTVMPDFKVKAFSLECQSVETGCTIEVLGDLKVQGGILGSEISAGGKISALYMSQCKVTCGGDLVVQNEIVGCKVECNGRVQVTAGEGRIVTCQITALRGASAASLLSSGGATVIHVGMRPDFEQKMLSTRRAMTTLRGEGAQLEEFLLAQDEELTATEGELRALLSALSDPGQSANRENLLAQVQMIKPLRQALKDGVTGGRNRLEEIRYQLQRLSEKLAEMEALVPTGNIWLDVRTLAEAGTEIRGPHSAVALEQNSTGFSARELGAKDKDTGAINYAIKLGPLRSGA